MKIFQIEFEADETVEGQVSFAGHKTWIALADSSSHAEKLFFDRLKKNGLFLREEDPSYSITKIPDRAGITEVS